MAYTLQRTLAWLLLIVVLKLSPVVGSEKVRSFDGECKIYNYITDFAVKKVDESRYRLESAFCQALPDSHLGHPTQCVHVPRRVYRTHENWNECPAGFFLQSNYQFAMRCCKPADQPYTVSECYDQTSPPTFEVHCPAGFILAKTRDSICSHNVCTTAVSCCKMDDESHPVLSLEKAKIRVMDDTQVPLSLLAHFLGYGWCGGCNGRYVGESMKFSQEGWQGDESGTCHGFKSNNRLNITYSDWKLLPLEPVYSEVENTDLTPRVILTGEIINNDTHSNTFTVGQELTRTHTVTHTKMSSITLSRGAEFHISYVPIFIDGIEVSTTYRFGYETTEEEVRETEKGTSSTISYGSEITLDPCTAVEYRIFLASSKATQYYNATLQVSYAAELNGFLRYGEGRGGRLANFHYKYRGSRGEPQMKYKFGNDKLSLHDDLRQQVRDGKIPWEWKNMIDRYPLAPTIIDMLADHSRHEYHLSGRFEEVAGHTARILFQRKAPPAGCVKPTAMPPTEMKWDNLYLRTINMGNGAYSDSADEEVENLLGPFAPETEESPEEQDQLFYLKADGTRNPDFHFGAFMVALGEDKLMASGRKSFGARLLPCTILTHLIPILMATYRLRNLVPVTRFM